MRLTAQHLLLKLREDAVAESPSGGLKLDVVLHDFDDDVELDQFGPEVHIVLSRSACLRIAEIFGGRTEPGSLGRAARAATFTRELNDLLVHDGSALLGLLGSRSACPWATLANHPGRQGAGGCIGPPW